MAILDCSVYLSTYLLEKNRSNGKGPSLLVSDWIEQTGEDGFLGLDLWMNHLRLASRSEWELIREKATDADLQLGMISVTLPTDASDKSQKLRESILEACDYFEPSQLKIYLRDLMPGEKAQENAQAGIEDFTGTLDFLREWSRDISREISFLCDLGDGKNIDSLSQILSLVKNGLGGGRFKAAINPFAYSPEAFSEVFKEHAGLIGNFSVQAKVKESYILLEEKRVEHAKIISLAQAKGFTGTWTIEATKGMGSTKEKSEDLFDNAEKDLNFLKEVWVRASE